MRVTNSMMFDMLTKDILRANEKLLGTYEEISSGKKINRPSDAPAKIPSIMVYNKILSGIEQYRRNIQFSRGELNTAEGALNGVTNSYSRLRELMLSSSTDTADDDSRTVASYEVNEIFNQLLSIGNTKVGDKYIFSGYLTTTQAFTSAGVYQGDTNELVVNIGADSTIKANVTGDDAFTYSDSTQLLSSVLSDPVGTGTFTFTVGSNNPVTVDITASNDEPKEVRDTINAPMTQFYASTANIGEGTLTLQVGNATPQELVVTSSNNTPTLLAAAINALNMGIEASLATDTVTTQERILFRPTITPGETITIDVSLDTDENDLDTGGLSGLLHTPQKSNLTENAIGVRATVINDTAGSRLLFRPTTEGTSYTIATNDDDLADTDTSGLSQLYHASSAATNLSSTMNVFTIVDHLYNSLQTNDRDGIDVSIALLDGASDQLLNIVAEVGGRQNKINLQEEWTEGFSVEATTLLSEMEDADMIEVSTALAKQQVTLQALQLATSKVFELNIFNLI